MNIVFFIKTLSGNVGILALILTMAVTILFGMGVPTTAAYVLVASLAGSVLIELGFDKDAVHLFIYYYAALANITPPVASAALVASQDRKIGLLQNGGHGHAAGPSRIYPALSCLPITRNCS